MVDAEGLHFSAFHCLCREEFAAVVLERVTGEFNRLQFSVSQTQDHPLIPDITPVSILCTTIRWRHA